MNGTDNRGASMRRWTLALGCSVLALGAAGVTPASAQCAPDPTQTDETTTCTGTDSDGIRITTDRSTVDVAAGATVVGTTAPAISVDIAVDPASYDPRSATINVAGMVDGGSRAGLSVVAGAAPPDYLDFYGTHVTATIAEGATVTGSVGMTAGASPGNAYGEALVSVHNAGTISGASGYGLFAANPARAGFEQVINAASGTIGAIRGGVGQLDNAGLIDGGTLSAVDQTATYGPVWPFGEWTNTGTIISGSSTSTIANLGQSQRLTNSGTISNSAAGAAIHGESLEIVNLAGGRIESAGGVALTAGLAVALTNAGNITGDIVVNTPQGYSHFSTIDSTAGTINGNVLLGRGNDVVYARYDGSATLVTGITGTLDAGEGVNVVALAATADLNVSTAVVLQPSFQRLRLAPAEGTTITLDTGFVAPGTIELEGAGTVVNKAAISTAAPAFLHNVFLNGSPELINEGSITTTANAGWYALDLDASRLSNSGTIVSAGRGVRQSGGNLLNTGSITAVGTAVDQFHSVFENQGIIQSTGGIGLDVNGSVGNPAALNSGRIEGATYGAVTGMVLNNSGTIAATGTGTAVGVGHYGVFNNLAGGVVEGGAYAVTTYGSSNAIVTNAGTINGNVSFVSPNNIGYVTSNTFVALTGGVLNGDLSLWTGDTLVADLPAPGEGPFAGINGNVIANGGLLRYRVTGEASAQIGPVGPFATTGYELAEGARLTLTAGAPLTLPLVLAGQGTVDLTANIATTNMSAVDVVPGITFDRTYAEGGLTITNRGTLSGTKSSYWADLFGVVSLGGENALVNEGTIQAAYTSFYNGAPNNAAVAFGGSLVNNGRIELDASYGTYNVDSVTNTGTIVQTGPGESVGIAGASEVTNSGTIRTGAAAIQNSYTIVNSGVIASTGGSAIVGGGLVTNLSGGAIEGAPGALAIRYTGAVINSGTIVGDVDLQSGNGGSLYYAHGGTLTGNLSLGYGNDLFLQDVDGPTGVSGLIDGGYGQDAYGRVLTSTGTIAVEAAPGTGFEDALVAALGADTVATLTAIDPSYGSFHAIGDGTIVNQVALNDVAAGIRYWSGTYELFGDGPLGGLTNTASIAGGIRGSVTRLVNSGTIGSATLAAPALAIGNAGALSFTNSGRIANDVTNDQLSYLAGGNLVEFDNTGEIESPLSVYAVFNDQGARGTLKLANKGTIRTAGADATLLVSAYGDEAGIGGSVSIANSGAISATHSAGATGLSVYLNGEDAAMDYSIQNSGSIAAIGGGAGSDERAIALLLGGTGAVSGTIANGADGLITASGPNAVALRISGSALVLDNEGQIVADGDGSVAIETVDAFDDIIRNRGTIRGGVLLGDGNDRFVQRAGATLAGVADGGAGSDVFELDATGNGSIAADQLVNFERLTQTGTGSIAYAGSFGVDTINLDGGSLSVAAGTTLATAGATTITGGANGVTVVNAGAIAGGITLGAGADTILNEGEIRGAVQLGAGDDLLTVTSIADLARYDGGAGYDTLRLRSANALTLGGLATGFEGLASEGSFMLTLAGGAFAPDEVAPSGGLTIAADAALTTGRVAFGAGDNRMIIAGRFAGAVDGGAGSDTIEVSGGSSAVPIAFSTISAVEALRMSAGYATIQGAAALGEISLSGGRLVGLAGSSITAPTINVGAGATFGSAGSVTGNVVVAGTLSPGASPGTMTVNGNVTLAASSVSVFEITPTVSDQLVVNGGVTIANGATLQLATTDAVTPGRSLDLIVASGGIAGSFTTVTKPASLFGFVVQRADRIQLLGQFLNSDAFSPQVQRSVDYLNGVLTSGTASPALLNAVPQLVSAAGQSDEADFARLTPEVFASAQQVAVENGLTLAEAGRGSAFAHRSGPGAFVFGTGLLGTRTLKASSARGTDRAETNGYGLLAGLGYAGEDWSIGAFGGYLDNRQTLRGLEARTESDGVVAGVHARWARNGFGVKATVAYDGGDAESRRAVPGGTTTSGQYGLHAWIADISFDYDVPLATGWTVRPNLGLTAVRSTRGRVAESGSPFALTVERERDDALFVDGGLTFTGGQQEQATLRPYLSLGGRYQLEGRRPGALASLGGGDFELFAEGAPRASFVASATLGADLQVTRRFAVFGAVNGETGNSDRRINAQAGVRLAF